MPPLSFNSLSKDPTITTQATRQAAITKLDCSQDKTRPNKTRPNKTRHHKTRQDLHFFNRSQDNTTLNKIRQDKTRPISRLTKKNHVKIDRLSPKVTDQEKLDFDEGARKLFEYPYPCPYPYPYPYQNQIHSAFWLLLFSPSWVMFTACFVFCSLVLCCVVLSIFSCVVLCCVILCCLLWCCLVLSCLVLLPCLG